LGTPGLKALESIVAMDFVASVNHLLNFVAPAFFSRWAWLSALDCSSKTRLEPNPSLRR
jgi:hypothetical protein